MIRYIFLLICFASSSAWGLSIDTPLADPQLESQAKSLFKTIRCMVCDGQALSESDAPLAQDMRLFIRNKLQQGSTPKQIEDFLISRYGDQILTRPRLNAHTIFLWGAPILLLILGGGYTLIIVRKHTQMRVKL